MEYYAGIGSRETPQACLDMMYKIARVCSRRGLVLRSGSAKGADTAFERGCDYESGAKEIWNPKSQKIPIHDWAVEKAREVCWEYPLDKMKPYTKSLIVRNMYQVFGDDPHELKPIKFAVYFSVGDPLMVGKESGGTRYAVRAAHLYGIPTFNLRVSDSSFTDFLKHYPNPIPNESPF